MKKILGLLIWVLALSACSSKDDPAVVPGETQAGRTLLTFLWADNNLTYDLQGNIHDMMYGLVDMTEPATLLVYWDGKRTDANWKTPVIVAYRTDGEGRVNGCDRKQLDNILLESRGSLQEIIALGTVLKVYPDQVSTRPQVMEKVLGDMMAAVPSASYGLIFGSHGSGWLPSITGTRSIGQDGEGTNNTLQIPVLATVLKTALQKVGQDKFDFVLFDACMMGSAEVYYALKDVTRYCLASVLDIPASGFPYERLVADFFVPDLSTSLSRVCDAYIEAHNGQAWGTISWVDCSRMQALADATRLVLQANRSRMRSVRLEDLQEYGRERYFSTTFVGIHCDMVQYLEALADGELPASFRAAFEAAVRYTSYTPTVGHGCHYYQIDGSNYCGMGMYIPYYPVKPESKAEYWNSYFRLSMSWYEAAGWAETSASWMP